MPHAACGGDRVGPRVRAGRPARTRHRDGTPIAAVRGRRGDPVCGFAGDRPAATHPLRHRRVPGTARRHGQGGHGGGRAAGLGRAEGPLVRHPSDPGEPDPGRRRIAVREAGLVLRAVPVRIALPGGAGVLDSRNNAADALRLGTAIVNTAGGFGGPANASRAHERLVEFPDPHAEPKTLSTLRRRLWLARPAGSPAPYVFEGYARAHLPAKIPRLRRPAAYLGRSIDVTSSEATFPLDATSGRHIAVIGPSESGAELLDSAARSLAAQHRPGTVSFVVAPLVVAAEEIGPALTDALTAAGHPTTIVDAAGLRIVLESDASDTYVIGFGMEGFDGDLRKFLREGPACRSHLIGWWRGLRRFGNDTGGSSGRDDVAGIVLLNVPVNDAARFLGETELDWRPGPNRALLHDRRISRTEVIVPFARVPEARDVEAKS